ncbi:CHAT domain-containing protein [Streptomyces sp. NPDC001978]|uniref:CHAT domain-containing protein n=1 Tax=Streptomyces sp. NPDC001978 TaxID=3364627 RepID=UPI0036A7BB46
MTDLPAGLPPAPSTGALELATVLSVATRIEPELIRAVRLRLLPHLDVGAEADLWFSDWVSARTPEAIALLPECLPYLRQTLAQKLRTDSNLQKIIEIVDEYHSELSPALLLEEQVTWHSLIGDGESVTRYLNQALHALVRQGRSGLAGWFADAWVRLPASARSTAAAWSLANAARTYVPSLDPGTAPELALSDIESIATAVSDIRLGVLREGSDLALGEVRAANAAAILVPDTRPRLVEVGTQSSTHTVRIDPGTVVHLRVGTGPVSLRTGSGRLYELGGPALTTDVQDDDEQNITLDELDPVVQPELVPRLIQTIRRLLEHFHGQQDRSALDQAVALTDRILSIGYAPRRFPELGCEAAEVFYAGGVGFPSQRLLHQAEEISEQLLHDGNHDRAVRALPVFAAVRRELFAYTGALEQLHVSVDYLEFFVARELDRGANIGQLLPELLRVHALLHEAEPREDRLEHALDLARRASPKLDRMPEVALPLARLHLARHQVTGNPSDLSAAEDLVLFTHRLTLSPAVQAEVTATRALVCLARFWIEGARSELQDAVRHLRKATSPKLAHNRLLRLRLRVELSQVLRLHAHLLQDPKQRDEALRHAQQAAKLLPKAALWRLTALNTLRRCLLDAFHATGQVSHLDEAIALFQDAVSAVRAHRQSPQANTALVQHAQALILRYRVTGLTEALDEAITVLETSATPPSDASLPLFVTYQTALASALLERHASQANPLPSDDLARALDMLDAVLRERPEPLDDMLAPAALTKVTAIAQLGTGAPVSTVRVAAQQAERLAKQRTLQPLQRLKAALAWGSLAMQLDSTDDVIQSYETARSELPPLLLLRSSEGQDMVKAWEQHGTQAAAWAISAGQPERALEFLEQRSVLLSSPTLDSPADIDQLRGRAPGLAGEIRWLWALLNLEPEPAQTPLSLPRGNYQRQMDRFVSSVRYSLPGYENFFARVSAHQLVAAATDGPLVVLNATDRRCDALLVTSQGVTALPLPRLQLNDLREQATRYAAITARGFERPLALEAADVLAWLWDTTVQPVMTALRLNHRPSARSSAALSPSDSVAVTPHIGLDDALPRLWWCLTGAFTSFPLHAAGNEDHAAMDYAVHSYIPNIRTLIRARRRYRSSAQERERRMLVVVGDYSLPYSTAEAPWMLRFAPEALVLRGAEATAANVASALADHPFFHFTGHARIHNGVAELQLGDEALTSRDLSMSVVVNGALAYLSACGTAGDGYSPESGWTLAASLQAAGYRHVIAVLGQISDRAASRLAAAVYESLLDATGRLRPEHSARALHRALQKMRATSPQDALACAGAVHLGP